jgi:hypothetical protein
MAEYINVKQGTIICQDCGDVIDSVDSQKVLKHAMAFVQIVPKKR